MQRWLPHADPRRDLVRAMFCVLAVLAQLLLPSALDRAHASEAQGCYSARAGDGAPDEHALDRHCASCLPQYAFALPTPTRSAATVTRTSVFVGWPRGAESSANIASAGRPPPTGPPLFV